MPDDNHDADRIRGGIEWRRAGWVTWTTIGWVLLGLGALWVLSRMGTVVLSLSIGLMVAFLLRPAVERLVARRFPRWAAVATAYLSALLVLAAVIALLVPMISDQADQMATVLPDSVERARSFAEEARARYEGLRSPEWVLGMVDETLQGLQQRSAEFAEGAASWLQGLLSGTAGLITGLLTGLVIGFYLLIAPPREESGDLPAMPPHWRHAAREAAARVEKAVGGFIRGQALVALAVGVLSWIGFALVGMPFSALLGLLTGILAVVPFLGPIVAAVLAAIVGLLVDPLHAVWGVVVVVIVQQIEGAVITPRVMRGQVGLHPVVVILAVIAGQNLFGFVGLLLAIPVTAAVRALWEYYSERRGWREAPRAEVIAEPPPA